VCGRFSEAATVTAAAQGRIPDLDTLRSFLGVEAVAAVIRHDEHGASILLLQGENAAGVAGDLLVNPITRRRFAAIIEDDDRGRTGTFGEIAGEPAQQFDTTAQFPTRRQCSLVVAGCFRLPQQRRRTIADLPKLVGQVAGELELLRLLLALGDLLQRGRHVGIQMPAHARFSQTEVLRHGPVRRSSDKSAVYLAAAGMRTNSASREIV
jgi:hypothetical protein